MDFMPDLKSMIAISATDAAQNRVNWNGTATWHRNILHNKRKYVIEMIPTELKKKPFDTLQFGRKDGSRSQFFFSDQTSAKILKIVSKTEKIAWLDARQYFQITNSGKLKTLTEPEQEIQTFFTENIQN